MKTRQLHYFSGLTITVFVGLHLFNHLLSIDSAERHIEMMEVIRHFYRNRIIEIILLGAVLIQIVSGLMLFKKSRKLAVTPFEKLHIWSGLYLAFFLILHVFAVFAGRYVMKLDTNFYYGAAGINVFPYSLFFVPYYALAIISFFGHIAAVHNKKMKKRIAGLSPAKQALNILVFGCVLTLLIFFGLTNHFHGITVPTAYNGLVGR